MLFITFDPRVEYPRADELAHNYYSFYLDIVWASEYV